MATNCLFGCVPKYSGNCLVKTAEEGDTLAPWVRVRFKKGNGATITVGNQSAPDNNPKNTAVIEKFQYGYSDGFTTKVEIHDEQGGSFVKFIDNILKNFKDLSASGITMEFEFGWVKNNCKGDNAVRKSGVLKAVPLNAITSFSQGRIKYEIGGSDVVTPSQEGRESLVFGTDDKPMHLTDAIRELFKSGAPPIIETVDFLQKINGKDTKPFEWNIDGADGKAKGPKGVWKTHGKQKLAAVWQWITDYTTKNKKGIKAVWDAEDPKGRLIFLEDPSPSCGQVVNFAMQCIGVFIVNGGNCSPVLSFEPQVRWTFSPLGTTGGGLGKGTPKAQQNEGSDQCKTLTRSGGNGGVGIGQNITPNDNTTRHFAPGDLMKNVNQAKTVHARANPFFHETIQAEMRIVGEPELFDPKDLTGLVATVIVINPFHITPSGNGCGEWLANPGCNPVLSNSNWRLRGVDHQITAGNFTTTLSLYLIAPASTLDFGDVLGGAGSNGYQLPS